MYYLIVLTIKKRKNTALKLQKALSKYGHLIKTRLGIHETLEEEHEGLIILHVSRNSESENLLKELNKIEDLNAKLVKIK